MHAEKRNTLIGAIETAQANWSSCDWCHERHSSDGKKVYHEDDSGAVVEYCNGGHEDTCSYCREATADAEEASLLGDEAIAALQRNDDIDSAVQSARKAVSLEQKWGDAPTWGPVLRALETAEGSHN